MLKGVTEQKGGFLSMLLGALGASLLGNILTGKGIYRAGKGVLRAVCGRPSSSASQIIIIKWIFNTAPSFH